MGASPKPATVASVSSPDFRRERAASSPHSPASCRGERKRADRPARCQTERPRWPRDRRKSGEGMSLISARMRRRICTHRRGSPSEALAGSRSPEKQKNWEKLFRASPNLILRSVMKRTALLFFLGGSFLRDCFCRSGFLSWSCCLFCRSGYLLGWSCGLLSWRGHLLSWCCFGCWCFLSDDFFLWCWHLISPLSIRKCGKLVC